MAKGSEKFSFLHSFMELLSGFETSMLIFQRFAESGEITGSFGFLDNGQCEAMLLMEKMR